MKINQSGKRGKCHVGKHTATERGTPQPKRTAADLDHRFYRDEHARGKSADSCEHSGQCATAADHHDLLQARVL
ncbi:hypothetical protein SDC9_159460 [bioreactor metagenome]|uniref:Uncharacterized protein n=1 Tax=bioreactor metagenome TaxID=1076179 RepID=A0A645FCP4_9ZZZZ